MEYLTTKQAAGKLGVAARTIRLWCRDGKIPGAKHMGRDWLMPESALDHVSRGVGGRPLKNKEA